MSDWPSAVLEPLVTINPWSMESIGAFMASINQSMNGGGSAAWPSANRAVYVPFRLSKSITVVKMWTLNGATASGNIDIGIYDYVGLARIVSIGPTAQAGTSAIQQFDIADTVLGPGQFYMAMSLSNTTGTIFRQNPSNNLPQLAGVAQQASAGTLPATATPVALTSSHLPLFGLTTRALA